MSTFIAVLFWFSTAVIILGLAYKIRQYWVTPAPLKIPTTPAPTTKTGVVLRMAREVVVFESLFKSNLWIWIFGWMFHVSLFLVLARHLRYFQEQPWFLVNIVQPFGKYAAFGMVIGLLGLLARRIFVDRVRYISSPSDYLMLIMLIVIGVSGMVMSFIQHTDIIAVKEFFLAWMGFSIAELPDSLPLIIHLVMVAVLLFIFPFSKLLHAPGVFFSPTRNQVDNPREQRHLSDWAAKLESDKPQG
ncbi:MAG: respiratory nitrate reductase subunit gamma [Gammaproteobacteria bacterium]|nr:respiratory nitrate reductase subunit gamma [Gammaproteobacteria bacterium]